MAEAFGEAGVRVVEVAAYESGCPGTMPEITARALAERAVAVIAFSSGKTAQHTARLLEQHLDAPWLQHLDGVKLISIGPQTSLSCQKHFGRVDAEATRHDLEGLVTACCQAMQSGA